MLIFILLTFDADKGRAFSLASRLLNVDRYSIPTRITIQVQTRKMARFSKTNWNLEINSNKFQDIDKKKLCTKFNRAISTRKLFLLCMMTLYLWRKFFFQIFSSFSKNMKNFEIISSTLRGISERKLCRIFHWAVTNRMYWKVRTLVRRTE